MRGKMKESGVGRYVKRVRRNLVGVLIRGRLFGMWD
jgi:hypothetical protein